MTNPDHTAAASSVFNWRGAGNAAAAAPEPPAASQQRNPEKEETMPTKNGGPQVAICTLLAASAEGLSRDEIGAKLTDLSAAQISSALNNSKSNGRIVWIDKSQVYRITKSGSEWLAGTSSGDTPETKPKRAAGARKKKTAHRRGRAMKPAKEVDTSPSEGEAATFRCGEMSDGAFFVSKGEVAIELEPEEYTAMKDYQARMAAAA